MVNHTHKCIFVHITKTGGTSIQTALKLSGSCHVYATKMKDAQYSDYWNDYFKFSFVRNPWDKMVSQYYFNHTKWVKPDTSFSQYIKKMGAGIKITAYEYLHLPYLQDKDKTVLVDFIGRFESLQEDFNAVCDKIETPRLNLRHVNKSNHKHYTEYYDDETREIVADKFKEDIDHFGYKFGQ